MLPLLKRPVRGVTVAVGAALMVGAPLHSQERDSVAAPTGGSVPAPDPADVESIDAIIAALYDVISGPAGQTRDWDRFRSLHVPEARLIPTFIPQNSSTGQARVWTVEDYIEAAGPQLEQNGFYEREIGRVTERFESIAHVFSTYDSRGTPDGEVFQRGINSIQLMWDNDRWWIVNIFWRGVGADAEIPAKYLSAGME